jgi:hypothetical protein
MAYRNGTYIAFHAEGKTDPTASDIKYYRMLKAWHENDDIDFKCVNSHDKVAAVRDTSTAQTIMRSLRERIKNSKNMLLIIGETTRLDTDFVPYEIKYAVDTCSLPIICVYTGYSSILHPKSHRNEWPPALTERIDTKTVRAIHIPFKQKVIDAAIRQFHLLNMPSSALSYYSKEAQKKLGIVFKA